MNIESRRPDGPDRPHQHPRRFDLCDAAGSAGARPRDLSYYTPDRIAAAARSCVRAGAAAHRARPGRRSLHARRSTRVDLASFDVMLLRQDPPFDLAYITTTHMLERIHPKTLVVNDPAQRAQRAGKNLRDGFPDLMPPTLISRDLDEIKAFRAEHGDVVMKPLYGHGGARGVSPEPQDLNFGSLFDMFSVTFREPWVIQQFLPEVKHGDKRIILVDGEFAGAVNRVPAADDLRSNMVRGGAAQATDLSAREREICATRRPRAAQARPAVRRHRRDQRQPHRDQRDLADRHPRHRRASAAPMSLRRSGTRSRRSGGRLLLRPRQWHLVHRMMIAFPGCSAALLRSAAAPGSIAPHLN